MGLQDKIKNAKETSWPLDNWKTIDSLTILAKGLDCLGDTEHAEDIRQAIDTMRKYQKIQADYENRLKADMVAIFTDLQLEIEEKATELCDEGWWLTYNDIIQQKINSLKESTDGME